MNESRYKQDLGGLFGFRHGWEHPLIHRTNPGEQAALPLFDSVQSDLPTVLRHFVNPDSPRKDERNTGAGTALG